MTRAKTSSSKSSRDESHGSNNSKRDNNIHQSAAALLATTRATTAAGGQVWEHQPGVLTQLSVISCPFIHMEGFFISASRASLACLHKGMTQPAGLPTPPAKRSRKILDPMPLTGNKREAATHALAGPSKAGAGSALL